MNQQKPVVIVTGSSGLIGAPVVRRLARSARVVGFDREGNPHPPRHRAPAAWPAGLRGGTVRLLQHNPHARVRATQLAGSGADAADWRAGGPQLRRAPGAVRAPHSREEWESRTIPEPFAKAGAWLQDKAPVGREPFIKPWMVALADDDCELDISRARTTIRREPRHSHRETLPKMIARLREDPVGWYGANKLEPSPWLAYVTPESVSTASTA